MLNLIIGIVLGAVFSPFWIRLFNYLKEVVKNLVEKFKNK